MHDADAFRLSTVGHIGNAARDVVIAPSTIAVAWNLQGPPANALFIGEVRRLFDTDLPVAPNATTRRERLTALWLGPRSWLLVAGYPSMPRDFDTTREAINAAGGALFDVSASRIAWTIAGPRAATVLASGCPLDFHPRAFPACTCAQSVFGHVNVLVEKRDDSPAFVLMVARSFASDVEHALATVAAQYGCDVLAARPYG